MQSVTPSDDFIRFLSRYPLRVFKKGETILLKDDIPDGMYVIDSGFVKTYSITADGDERLVSIDQPGEDFPIGFGLGLIDRSTYFYEAYTRCAVRVVPGKDYVEYLRSDNDTMYARHVRLMILLLSAFDRVNALEQPGAQNKLGYTLLYMANRLGVMLPPYRNRRTIAITQQELANALGLARETTSIELKKLEALHLVAHTRKKYIVYMERLKEYLRDH